MNVEEIVWCLLFGNAPSKDLRKLNNYEIYYIYSILIEIRTKIVRSLTKYREELGERFADYLILALKNLDNAIEEIYPRVKDMNICYGVLEASITISKIVSKRVFEKLMLILYRKLQRE